MLDCGVEKKGGLLKEIKSILFLRGKGYNFYNFRYKT